MIPELETLRDNLALLKNVATCKIGIEPNIAPDDYPLIRIVPQRFTPDSPYHRRLCETGIYFGAAVTQAEGTELVYSTLFDMEAAIIKELKAQGHKYFETITDEDALDTYKMMYIRADIYVQRPEA